jgi:hypothetical protein
VEVESVCSIEVLCVYTGHAHLQYVAAQFSWHCTGRSVGFGCARPRRAISDGVVRYTAQTYMYVGMYAQEMGQNEPTRALIHVANTLK